MWYSLTRLLSYGSNLNFVLSNRGGGKTYSATRWCINDFKKTGAQFVYIRRFRTDLEDIGKFFDAIKEKYPKDKFEVKGGKNKGEFLINGKVAGHYFPLSVSHSKKSTNFPKVNKIIFDEFISESSNGLAYLPNEVEKFLGLIETIQRLRTSNNIHDQVRCLLLANNVTLMNPYFLYFKIKPKDGERFSLFRNGIICIEMFTDTEFIDKKKNTWFGKLIDNTKYGDYLIENKALKDSNTFIIPVKPSRSYFLFSVKYENLEVGIWSCPYDDMIYCSRSLNPTSKRRYVLTKQDLDLNYCMIKNISQSREVRQLTECFSIGRVYYQDMEIKNCMYNVLGLFRMR